MESFHIEDKIEINSISLNRFIILCFCSLGFYQFWWIYKSWKFFCVQEQLKVHAGIRTILPIIFLFPLFYKIRKYSKQFGFKNLYSSIIFYFGFLGFNILVYFPDPLWVFSKLSFIALIIPFITLDKTIDKDSFYYLIIRKKIPKRHLAIIFFGIISWSILIYEIVIHYLIS